MTETTYRTRLLEALLRAERIGDTIRAARVYEMLVEHCLDGAGSTQWAQRAADDLIYEYTRDD